MPRTVRPVVVSGAMSSISQPTLQVDHELSLRPFERHDSGAVQTAFSDPAIVRWHGFIIDSADEAGEWIDRNHQKWIAERCAVWAVVDGADAVLGRCALHVDLERGVGEIAYWVLREARGHAVATRAAQRVTAWAHHELGLHRIVLLHSTENAASCAVADRVGYRVEGTARGQGLHADGWHDMHQHAHLATD